MTPLHWMQVALSHRKLPVTSGALAELRNHELVGLVTHAYCHVPYYRRLFDQAGIVPSDIRTAEDLVKIPISSKDDMRLNSSSTLSDQIPANKLVNKFTTGSTGEPFLIRRTMWEAAASSMIIDRNFKSYGIHRRDRMAVISMHAKSSMKASGSHALLRDQLRRIICHRIHLNCLEDPVRLLDQLERLQPDIILSYAGILARLGDLMTERNKPVWCPRFLLSGSETLTPLRRRQIETGFGARVYDFYAAYETGMLAWECRKTGLYHVADDHVILEITRDGRNVPPADGGKGEVVVTNLHAYAMPFIRYRLNDAVVLGPSQCPCGAPFSTLRTIEGRLIDYFILPGGRNVHPLGIARSFIEFCPGIKQYQIVQESPDRILVRIVHSPNMPKTGLPEIPGRIQEYLGIHIHVRLEFLEQMNPEPAGKYKLFISHVSR